MALRVDIYPAKGGVKKYTAVFYYEDGKKKTIHFGDKRYQDYTQHNDMERRKAYLTRHEAREDWESPDNAGSLSAWLLWGEHTDFKANLAEYKKYFEINAVLHPGKNLR